MLQVRNAFVRQVFGLLAACLAAVTAIGAGLSLWPPFASYVHAAVWPGWLSALALASLVGLLALSDTARRQAEQSRSACTHAGSPRGVRGHRGGLVSARPHEGCLAWLGGACYPAVLAPLTSTVSLRSLPAPKLKPGTCARTCNRLLCTPTCHRRPPWNGVALSALVLASGTAVGAGTILLHTTVRASR